MRCTVFLTRVGFVNDDIHRSAITEIEEARWLFFREVYRSLTAQGAQNGQQGYSVESFSYAV